MNDDLTISERFERYDSDRKRTERMIKATSWVTTLTAGSYLLYQMHSRMVNPLHAQMFEANLFRMLSKITGVNTEETYNAYRRMAHGGALKGLHRPRRRMTIKPIDPWKIRDPRDLAAVQGQAFESFQDLHNAVAGHVTDKAVLAKIDYVTTMQRRVKAAEERIGRLVGSDPQSYVLEARMDMLDKVKDMQGIQGLAAKARLDQVDDALFEDLLLKRPSIMEDYMTSLRRKYRDLEDVTTVVEGSKIEGLDAVTQLKHQAGRQVVEGPGETGMPWEAVTFQQKYPTAQKVLRAGSNISRSFSDESLKTKLAALGHHEHFGRINKLLKQFNVDADRMHRYKPQINFFERKTPLGYSILTFEVSALKGGPAGTASNNRVRDTFEIYVQNKIGEYQSSEFVQPRVANMYEPKGHQAITATDYALAESTKDLEAMISDLVENGHINKSIKGRALRGYETSAPRVGAMMDIVRGKAVRREIIDQALNPYPSRIRAELQGWRSMLNMSQLRGSRLNKNVQRTATGTIAIDLEVSDTSLTGKTGPQPRAGRGKVYQIGATARDKNGKIVDTFNMYIKRKPDEINREQIVRMFQGDEKIANRIINNIKNTHNTEQHVVGEFKKWMSKQNGHLMGYNAEYDSAFLRKMLPSVFEGREWIDTYRIGQVLEGNTFERRMRLSSITEEIVMQKYGLSREAAGAKINQLMKEQLGKSPGAVHTALRDSFFLHIISDHLYDQMSKKYGHVSPIDMRSQISRLQKELSWTVVPLDQQMKILEWSQIRDVLGAGGVYFPTYLHSVSTSMALKGIGSTLDILKLSPFGQLMDTARPLYQQMMGSKFRVWPSKLEERVRSELGMTSQTRVTPFVSTHMAEKYPEFLHSRPLVNTILSFNPLTQGSPVLLEQELMDKITYRVAKKTHTFNFTTRDVKFNDAILRFQKDLQAEIKEEFFKTNMPHTTLIDDMINNPFWNYSQKSKNLEKLRQRALESLMSKRAGRGYSIRKNVRIADKGDSVWKFFDGDITNVTAMYGDAEEGMRLIIDATHEPAIPMHGVAMTSIYKGVTAPFQRNQVVRNWGSSINVQAFAEAKLSANPGAMFEGMLLNAVSPVLIQVRDKTNKGAQLRFQRMTQLLKKHLGAQVAEGLDMATEALYGGDPGSLRYVLSDTLPKARTMINTLGEKGTIDVIEEALHISGNVYNQTEVSQFYQYLGMKKKESLLSAKKRIAQSFRRNLQLDKQSKEVRTAFDYILDKYLPEVGRGRLLGFKKLRGQDGQEITAMGPLVMNLPTMLAEANEFQNMPSTANPIYFDIHGQLRGGLKMGIEDFDFSLKDPTWTAEMKNYLRRQAGLRVQGNVARIANLREMVKPAIMLSKLERQNSDLMRWGKEELFKQLAFFSDPGTREVSREAAEKSFLRRVQGYKRGNILIQAPKILKNTKLADKVVMKMGDLFPEFNSLTKDVQKKLANVLGASGSSEKTWFNLSEGIPLLSPQDIGEAAYIHGSEKSYMPNIMQTQVNIMSKVKALHSADTERAAKHIEDIRELYGTLGKQMTRYLHGFLRQESKVVSPGFVSRIAPLSSLTFSAKMPKRFRDSITASNIIIPESMAERLSVYSLAEQSMLMQTGVVTPEMLREVTERGEETWRQLHQSRGSGKGFYPLLYGHYSPKPVAEAGLWSQIPASIQIQSDKYLYSGRRRRWLDVAYVPDVIAKSAKDDFDRDKMFFSLMGDELHNKQINFKYFKDVNVHGSNAFKWWQKRARRINQMNVEEAVKKGALQITQTEFDSVQGKWVEKYVPTMDDSLKKAIKSVQKGRATQLTPRDILNRGAISGMEEVLSPDRPFVKWIEDQDLTEVWRDRSLSAVAGKKSLGYAYNWYRSMNEMIGIAEATGDPGITKTIKSMGWRKQSENFASMYKVLTTTKKIDKWRDVIDAVGSLSHIENKKNLDSLIQMSAFKDSVDPKFFKFFHKLKNQVAPYFQDAYFGAERAMTRFIFGSAQANMNDLMSIMFTSSRTNVQDVIQSGMEHMIKESPLGSQMFLSRKTGILEAAKLQRRNRTAKGSRALGAKVLIGTGMGFLGLNMLRKDQMSNQFNPLDLGVDLGRSEGLGGEIYDYYASNALGVPKHMWKHRAYLEPGNLQQDADKLSAMVRSLMHSNTTRDRRPRWSDPEQGYYEARGMTVQTTGNIGLKNHLAISRITGVTRI